MRAPGIWPVAMQQHTAEQQHLTCLQEAGRHADDDRHTQGARGKGKD